MIKIPRTVGRDWSRHISPMQMSNNGSGSLLPAVGLCPSLCSTHHRACQHTACWFQGCLELHLKIAGGLRRIQQQLWTKASTGPTSSLAKDPLVCITIYSIRHRREVLPSTHLPRSQ